MQDLFPETLLVSRSGESIYTTSRKVAEHFGKQHAHVLRNIQKLLADLPDAVFSQSNFGLAEYLDTQKKPRIEYRLSHDGFALLAMGFTGREALAWKVKFLAAFRQMEAELAAARTRYLNALDIIRPNLRPTVEDFKAGLPRTVTAEFLGKSANAISYHRHQARRLGLLPVSRHARPKAHKEALA
ncbi:MAG: Rha family transcriptional regulator [Gallionellaceae bacterium]|jgi:Rha family phage regulatory protein|nr:Rha family transcriptional regulator [Gallionellaceae bacterium]